MTVRPVGFHPNGDVDVWHDEGNHGGTVAAANVAFAAMPTGPGTTAPTHDVVSLLCPVVGCGGGALHPLAGGADASRVQELFVRLAARVGCPCHQVAAGAALTTAQSHIKLQTVRREGLLRWEVVGQLK